MWYMDEIVNVLFFIDIIITCNTVYEDELTGLILINNNKVFE